MTGIVRCNNCEEICSVCTALAEKDREVGMMKVKWIEEIEYLKKILVEKEEETEKRISGLVDKISDCNVRELKLQAEITHLKGLLAGADQVIYDNIVAPNCANCSDFLSAKCDNGIICVGKVKEVTFINWQKLKQGGKP